MTINKTEIGTLAAEIDDQSILNNENIVKVITDSKITNENFTFAIDFKRKVNNLNYKYLPSYRHICLQARCS